MNSATIKWGSFKQKCEEKHIHFVFASRKRTINDSFLEIVFDVEDLYESSNLFPFIVYAGSLDDCALKFDKLADEESYKYLKIYSGKYLIDFIENFSDMKFKRCRYDYYAAESIKYRSIENAAGILSDAIFMTENGYYTID